MTGQSVFINNVPERVAAAAASGLLAWEVTRTVVPFWYAALPCAALTAVLLSKRLSAGWLTWMLGTVSLAIFLGLTLHSPHAEVIFASIILAVIFAALAAATCALVTSSGFPRQTASLVVWLAIAAALTGEPEGWIMPAMLAVLAGIGCIASRHSLRQEHSLPPSMSFPCEGCIRRLIPILVGLAILALIAGTSSVERSPVQGPLAALVHHALVPSTPVSSPPQEPSPATDSKGIAGTLIHYAAPMLQLWIDTLTRLLLPWAVPLVLGLLTLLAGLIMLLLITRSSLSHVLRMLMRPVLLLCGAVLAALAVSGLQLPRGPALAKLYDQLATISGLAKAQQSSAVRQAVSEATRAVPQWLQLLGIIFASVVAVAILVTTLTLLSKAIFDTRFGFLLNIPDIHERKQIAASIRRLASLDESSLAANPREAVIALFYMGVAALQDLNIALGRGETPEEFVFRASGRSELAASYLRVLAQGFYVARYSNQEIGLQRAIVSRDAYKSLLIAVKSQLETEHMAAPRAAIRR